MKIANITDSTKFKQWITTINDIISILKPASSSSDGLMSSADKVKLDSIKENTKDVNTLSVSVNDANEYTLVDGNDNKTILNFSSGNGIILETEMLSNEYNVSITSVQNEKASGATETQNGSLGLIQATAGKPNRMLFSDMTWRSASQSFDDTDEYPVSGIAVNNKLNEYAVKNHKSSDTIYGVGTNTEYGHVKLSDDLDSNLMNIDGVAATPFAVKTINDRLDSINEITLSNKEELSKLESKIVGIYKYAGSVDTYDDLLTITASIGDVYNVKTALGDDGPNYAWNGVSWDNLGGLLNVDTSPVQDSKNPITSGSVYDELLKKSPIEHSSSDTTYGIGTDKKYGHIKLTDSLDINSPSTDGIAHSAKAVNELWEYSKETRKIISDGGSYNVFHNPDEAKIPDVYNDKTATTSIPSKIAFAELNYDVSEISNRVESIETSYINKNGDEVTGNIVFSSGTFEGIYEEDSSQEIILINPNNANNFYFECSKLNYQIEVSDIDYPSATFYLVIKNGELSTFIWPDNVKWSNGLEPYLSSGIDILKFYTIDGGENWYVVHELSNSSSDIDIRGIIGESSGYINRITSKMLSKTNPHINEQIISTDTDNTLYYILTKNRVDNTIKIYTLTKNGEYSYIDTAIINNSPVKIKYIKGSLYVIFSNEVYIKEEDTFSLLYTVSENYSITDFTIFNDKPCASVLSKDNNIGLSVINDDSKVFSSIVSEEIHIEEFKQSNIFEIDNTLYMCYVDGILKTQDLINYFNIEFPCSAICKINNDMYLAYTNNGIGVIYDNVNSIEMIDYSYIGEGFIAYDIKFTHIGLIITGYGGSIYPDFSNDSDIKEKEYDFKMLLVPYSNNSIANMPLQLLFDYNKKRYYKSDSIESKTYNISLSSDYTVHKTYDIPSIREKINILALDDTKFIHSSVNNINGSIYPFYEISCDNNILDICSNSSDISDDIKINGLVDCHKENVNECFFAYCTNGYIIDNLGSTTLTKENIKIAKIAGILEGDNIVSGCYYSSEDETKKISCIITKNGYFSDYNYDNNSWNDAQKINVYYNDASIELNEIFNISYSSNKFIAYGIYNNYMVRAIREGDENKWIISPENINLYDLSNIYDSSFAISASNILEDKLIFSFCNNSISRIIIVSSDNGNTWKPLRIQDNIGRITAIEYASNAYFFLSSKGYIIKYSFDYGYKLSLNTYNTKVFSGFIKTFDNDFNVLLAVSEDGTMFRYNISKDSWNQFKNTLYGIKYYFSYSPVNA